MNEPDAREFWEGLDELVRTSTVVVERPRGSAHPRYPGTIYPLDYGYLAATHGSDGEPVDAFIGTAGVRGPQGMVCTVDGDKREVEVKVLLACTDEEVREVVRFLSAGMSVLLLTRP